jgi:hypothetical protein
MIGPHTQTDNPLSRIMCAPIVPPVTVCHCEIGLLSCFFVKKFYSLCQNALSDTSTSAGVKSTVIITSVNIFEVSKRDKPQYFVDKVKDKRRNKNNNLTSSSGVVAFLTPSTTRGILLVICQVENT